MKASRYCALSGVRLDDGNPLHRARPYRGQFVCLAVANVLEGNPHPDELRRFVATMLEREART